MPITDPNKCKLPHTLSAGNTRFLGSGLTICHVSVDFRYVDIDAFHRNAGRVDSPHIAAVFAQPHLHLRISTGHSQPNRTRLSLNSWEMFLSRGSHNLGSCMRLLFGLGFILFYFFICTFLFATLHICTLHSLLICGRLTYLSTYSTTTGL